VAQLDRRNGRMLDEAAVREKFGVSPASIPDWLALVGDSADGFPGLPGWGAKSAATVLARYEHVDAIPESAGDWDVAVRGATKLAATLSAQRAAAELFLTLATLRTDAPVGTVDDWRWDGPTPDLASWSERLGSPNLVSRAGRAAKGRP
jgi:5'-3' exonuclease